MTSTAHDIEPGRHAPADYDSNADGTPDDDNPPAPPPTGLIWAARVVSLGAVAAIIGYLLYLCFVRPEVAVQFDIALDFDAAEQRSGAWVLPVTVTNSSTNAVSSAQVEITQGGEARTSTLGLMGEGEEALMEVRFPDRPTESNTTAEILSYQNP